jgi:hypothetical protein
MEDVGRLYSNIMLFYIRDLGIHRFWYVEAGRWSGELEGIPENVVRRLCLFFSAISLSLSLSLSLFLALSLLCF